LYPGNIGLKEKNIGLNHYRVLFPPREKGYLKNRKREVLKPLL